jgi:hypothetical protein
VCDLRAVRGGPAAQPAAVRGRPHRRPIEAGEIVDRAGLVELLLDRCLDPAPVPAAPDDPGAAVEALMEMAAAELAARGPA